MAGYLTRLAAQTGLGGVPPAATASPPAPLFEGTGETNRQADVADVDHGERGSADAPTNLPRAETADPGAAPPPRPAADRPEPSDRRDEAAAGLSPDRSVSEPKDSDGGAGAGRDTAAGAAEAPARSRGPAPEDGIGASDRPGPPSTPDGTPTDTAPPALEPPRARRGPPAVDRHGTDDPPARQERSTLGRSDVTPPDREGGEASWLETLSRARRWVAGTPEREGEVAEESTRSADPVEPAQPALPARSDAGRSARSARSVGVAPEPAPALPARSPVTDGVEHAGRGRKTDPVSVSIGSIEVRVEAPAEPGDGGTSRAGTDRGADRRPAGRRQDGPGDRIRLDRHYIWS